MGNTNESTCYVKETFSVTVSKTSADGTKHSENRSGSREYVHHGGSRTMPPLSLHGEFGNISGGFSAGGSSALAIKK